MTGVTARLAASTDRAAVLELVRALLAELGGTPPAPAELGPAFERLTAGDDGHAAAGFIVIGEDADGHAIAVCTLSFLTALRARGRYGIIQEMFVLPAARSSGVGMTVLRFALEQAVANGCRMVELGTPADGERQIAFYRRAGFAEVGARLRWRA